MKNTVTKEKQNKTKTKQQQKNLNPRLEQLISYSWRMSELTDKYEKAYWECSKDKNMWKLRKFDIQKR